MNFINKIFGSKSQKKLKKITPLVSSINDLENDYSLLGDEELKKYRGKFISRYEAGAVSYTHLTLPTNREV